MAALAHDAQAASWDRFLDPAFREVVGREVDEFEAFVGHKLPDMLVALGLQFAYLESMLAGRFVNRWPLPYKFETLGGGLLSLSSVVAKRKMHLEWMVDETYREIPLAVRSWVENGLIPVFTVGTNHISCLDYQFDPVDPPIVHIDAGNSWHIARKNERTMWWGADNFEAFLRLPVRDDDDTGLVESDPPTTRESEWLAWRDDFWAQHFGSDA